MSQPIRAHAFSKRQAVEVLNPDGAVVWAARVSIAKAGMGELEGSEKRPKPTVAIPADTKAELTQETPK